jgi:maltose alpha-D-glucosyltransferase / alpha-amylase
VYGIDVGQFRDTDGDGHGDLAGVMQGLDHVRSLGASHVWLLPFYPHNDRDNGYDVTDHFATDALNGSTGDLRALLDAAHDRGLGVLVDVVANHTSDTHPWFLQARADPDSPYRDYYIWSRTKPPASKQKKPVFPTVEPSVWTFDRKARAYYHHMYYRSQPDLNLGNAGVRAYLREVVRFWMRLGVDGVRIDSAPHAVDRKDDHRPPGGARFLRELHDAAVAEDPHAILLGEADLPPAGLVRMFQGGRAMTLLLNFYLDAHVFLALARGDAEPIARALRELPRRPTGCQWLNCLRNLDELDLERLTPAEQEDVYAAFAPRKDMLAYDRGIRRRLAPMLGDPARLRLAQALLFALPGMPLLVYGDEIGMGEDLSRPEREAVRTPMQWDASRNAGFSQAPTRRLSARAIAKGPYRHQVVNVAVQEDDPRSMLNLVRRLARLRQRHPSLAQADPRVQAIGSVLVLRYPDVWVAANLASEPASLVAPAGRALIAERARRIDGRARLGAFGFLWVRTGARRRRSANASR